MSTVEGRWPSASSPSINSQNISTVLVCRFACAAQETSTNRTNRFLRIDQCSLQLPLLETIGDAKVDLEPFHYDGRKPALFDVHLTLEDLQHSNLRYDEQSDEWRPLDLREKKSKHVALGRDN